MSDISIPNFRFKKYTSNLVKTRLSKIATFNPKSSLPENFKYIDLESVLGTELVSYREETRESAPSRAQRVAQKGDVFYQMVRPYQKNNYLFYLNENNYVFSTGYAQLRPKVDSAFLLARLQEEGFVNKVIERCTGTSYPAINSKDLSRISITIPEDLDEQSAIGSLFRTLDDLLTSYKDNLANYQSLKATMLSKMFPKAGQTVPEIRLDGFEGEWKKDTLEPYLTESRISGDTGLTAKKITVKLWGKGVIEKEEKYAGSSNTQYFVRKAGQFIYSKLDFQNQAFGIIPNELDGYQSTLDLPTFDIQNIDPKFLLEYVMRREFYEYQGLIANGSRKAKRIHPEDFLVMPVRIPSLEEQQAIGSYFSNLDNLIVAHQEKISQLETLKKKLLQDMFI
ncbi:Type I restriction-modification system, specificity subunit S [Streptococcus thermophilus]|uniref:restriction endonuclease subunit S n=1 Tax=Streptococcus thermophilus TaxID=1308 RepID=UPI000EB706C5|nr:restriction endonuclease subunit S [Streptococcus thermophilus]AXT15246.1 restriction endonuclease subunit S [Streptococcus thermophilus]UTS67632.1 Type I restriction-modification system, specificity subunit S [Streptococcus thermophilus]